MEKATERKIIEFTDDMVKSDLGILMLIEKKDESLLVLEKGITTDSVFFFIMRQIIGNEDLRDVVRSFFHDLDNGTLPFKMEDIIAKNQALH